jgi:hypothetical protein
MKYYMAKNTETIAHVKKENFQYLTVELPTG